MAKQVASGNGVSQIEVKGSLGGDKALLRRNLTTDLARRWRGPVELNTADINDLPASLCKFTERFKPYRYDGAPRIILSKVERTTPGTFGVGDKKAHTLYIRVYPKTLHTSARIFSIESSGSVYNFGPIDTAIGFFGYGEEVDGAKQLEIATDSMKPAAILLIDSAKPVPASIIKDGKLDVGSLDKLDAIAKEGGWHIEMISYDLAAWDREMSAKR